MIRHRTLPPKINDRIYIGNYFYNPPSLKFITLSNANYLHLAQLSSHAKSKWQSIIVQHCQISICTELFHLQDVGSRGRTDWLYRSHSAPQIALGGVNTNSSPQEPNRTAITRIIKIQIRQQSTAPTAVHPANVGFWGRVETSECLSRVRGCLFFLCAHYLNTNRHSSTLPSTGNDISNIVTWCARRRWTPSTSRESIAVLGRNKTRGAKREKAVKQNNNNQKLWALD